MSLRSFTVFQDTVSNGPSQPKVTRSNALGTRSAVFNLGANPNATTLAIGDQVAIDKENVHPVTGERSGPTTNAGKKRKTSVLAAKVQPPVTKQEKEKDRDEPEKKKRKASTSSSSTGTSVKGKSSTKLKASGSVRKSSSKRASSRKVSPMPQLNEEEDENNGSNEKKGQERPTTQVGIDSRCYELTVKPLADVSQAYEDASPIGELPNSGATTTTSTAATDCVVDDHNDIQKVKFGTGKASSVEPELRDYFEDPTDLFSRLPSFSQSKSSLSSVADAASVPEGRTFSTPERKQIYAAFTFSSPSGSGSGSGSSLAERLDYSELNDQDEGRTSRSGYPSPSPSLSNRTKL